MYLVPILALLGAAQAILMPSPPGPYSVAVRDFELIDPNRIDNFAPKPNTKRRIMVSAYLPIDAKHHCKPEVIPYMPALTASVFGDLGTTLGIPNGTQECDESRANASNGVHRPLDKETQPHPFEKHHPNLEACSGSGTAGPKPSSNRRACGEKQHRERRHQQQRFKDCDKRFFNVPRDGFNDVRARQPNCLREVGQDLGHPLERILNFDNHLGKPEKSYNLIRVGARGEFAAH